MLSRNALNQLAETVSIGGLAASAVIMIATNTIFPSPQIATVSTATAFGCTVALKGVKRDNTVNQLRDERDAFQKSASKAETALKDLQNRLETGLKQRQEYYEGLLSELRSKVNSDADLRTKYEQTKQAFNQRATELNQVIAECTQLRNDAAKFEGIRSDWVQKFDRMISEHTQEVNALNDSLARLNQENIEYKARFSSIEETAKLRAEVETRTLKEKLHELSSQYNQVATMYNSAATDLKKLNAEYVSEFTELNEAVHSGIPLSFDKVLDARDQELMRLSGHLAILVQPQYFDSHGEYDRANRLIKVLYECDPSITVDASEIVPYADNSGFDCFLNLRDRKARGQAFIDALNDRGNEFSVHCGCIKDLKFEYDRVNPHRIKTAFVFRKPEKIAPKTTIDKLWIPSEQFSSKVYGLLKKPMTRVMGSTGEGKGLFANLLLATEANQATPSAVRLHDPMDGSSADYWKIPKTSKGKSATKKAVNQFAKEFADRLENQVSMPKVLDVFDEIDIVADSDSTINKTFLNAAKGMRHCGMKAVIIGQSPSVGKKGFEWADMDNFNAVYFGTAIVTAIEKTPALEVNSQKLKETYQKLSDYCDKQNEEHGLDSLSDWNAYRVGMVVTQGKATFFEMPNADSIVCDWNNLSSTVPAITQSVEQSKDDVSECLHSSSTVRKTVKNSEGVVIKQHRKCKDCGANFTVQL